MKLIRITLLSLIGLMGTVAVAAVVTVVCVVLFQAEPMFNRTHPDYEPVGSQFERARSALDAGEDWAVIDLVTINGGAWGTACLVGGSTWPVQRLEGLGAKVSPSDRDRLAKAFGLRAAPVEEFEMVAFEDERGQVHFIHFDRGIGLRANTTKRA